MRQKGRKSILGMFRGPYSSKGTAEGRGNVAESQSPQATWVFTSFVKDFGPLSTGQWGVMERETGVTELDSYFIADSCSGTR